MTLDHEDIAAIAELLADEREATVEAMAELVKEARSKTPGDKQLLTTSQLAARWQVDRSFIDRHRVELGGKRLGPAGPWRFDPAMAEVAPAPTPAPAPKPRRRRTPRTGVRLLPVRGEGGAA